MSIVDREKFLKGLSKSEVLEPAVVEEWLSGFESTVDSKKLAKSLVAKKLLTLWQAKMLLKGAYRLKFGNYSLTDRISKTEFGDCFAATHSQLSRQVRIQYLPTEFSDSRESKKKIFALGSKLSGLDHPNLVHVYDVDEERDRIYVVSGAPKGMSLKELLADAPPSCAAVAQVLRGCLKGINYAHSKDVVHGGITNETVFVKPNGEPQITSLTEFAVRNQLAESAAQTSDDVSSIKKIAKIMFRAISEEEKETAAYPQLKAALVAIKEDPDKAISLLDELVQPQSDIDGGMTLAAELPREPATAHPATALAMGRSSSMDDDALPVTEVLDDGFLASLARKNPVALIATAAAMALLLIGGTVFAASKLVAPATGSAVASADSAPGNSTDGKASKPGSRKSNSSKTTPARLGNSSGALSSDASASPVASAATDPAANMAAIDAIFASKDGAEAAPATPKKTEVAATEKAAESKPMAAAKVVPEPKAMPAPSEKEVAAAAPKPAPAATQPVAVAKEDMAKQEPKAMPKKPAVKKPAPKRAAKKMATPGADPFKAFATMVDLPPSNTTEQVSFGNLVLEKRYLLGAEILSTPLVHRSKPVFELMRSADDKQTWDISFKKKKKADPIVVAKLQKTPDELKFNWLPAAAENEAANYLRNCRFKLSTAKHSHWLTLRRPVKIDGFKLGAKKGSVKIDCEIPWLPNPVALNALARGIKIEKLDKGNRRQKAILEPAEITAKAPARMYFHEDKDRFLSIDIGLDIRKKMTLQAALVIQPSLDQPVVVVQDPSKFKQVTTQVRRIAYSAQQQADKAAKMVASMAANKPRFKPGDKKDDKNKARYDEAEKQYKDAEKLLKSTSTMATDKAEHCGYYEHVVPQLVDKEIPVTITYSLNEQHKVILAYTVESAETKKK